MEGLMEWRQQFLFLFQELNDVRDIYVPGFCGLEVLLLDALISSRRITVVLGASMPKRTCLPRISRMVIRMSSPIKKPSPAFLVIISKIPFLLTDSEIKVS
jgi:hypothetical protein